MTLSAFILAPYKPCFYYAILPAARHEISWENDGRLVQWGWQAGTISAFKWMNELEFCVKVATLRKKKEMNQNHEQ